MVVNDIGVWVVEVKHGDEDWRPVDCWIDRKDAIQSRAGWKKDAPHGKWRVTEYLPQGSHE
jgi:hypothetical protein